MRKLLYAPCVLLLAVAQYAVAADPVDLRRGVPDDVYLAVYGKHNPERDYQRQYYEDVWKTVQETQIVDDIIKIVTSQMAEEDVTKAKAVIDELREAAEPIDLEALADAKEVVYAQWMVMSPMPTAQHLVILRLTPEAASTTAEGVKNLFRLAQKYTNGELAVSESQEGDASICGLSLPPQSPMQPTIASMGDVFLFCSSKELLTDSIKRLAGGTGTSKFDDPRLVEALKKLPKMEDSLTFYDGKKQFEVLRGIGGFLQQVSGGDENVDRVAKILDKVWDDVAILDYDVTVEYTEGNLNRSASYTKLLPDTDDATLRKMLEGGEPFEKWYTWVPAGSLSYSLGTGVNLHPLYERIIGVLKEDVPEAAEALEQFEAMQAQFDLHLDRDILQAFSGEYVSVSVPAGDNNQPQGVLALRCSKPDRIKELIHRGMDALSKIEVPQLQAQQLKLVEAEGLVGFEQLSGAMLDVYNAHPVIGFRDGWMYLGMSADAVKKVLDTKAGQGETMEGTDAFRNLKLDVEGPVESISYANTAENTRNLAQGLNQIGAMAPMIMAMAGAQAGQADLKPIQEALALLPDVAQIIGKFDFLEAKMTVVQAGDEPNTVVKRSVTVVRPAETASAKAANDQ